MIYLTLKARNSLVLFSDTRLSSTAFVDTWGSALCNCLFIFFFFGGGGDYIGLLINHLIIC